MTEQQANLKEEAWAAFQRDLPQLYAEWPEQFVAYRGAEQLGVSAQKHLLYIQCFELGLQEDDFVVLWIGAYEDEIWIGPITVD